MDAVNRNRTTCELSLKYINSPWTLVLCVVTPIMAAVGTVYNFWLLLILLKKVPAHPLSNILLLSSSLSAIFTSLDLELSSFRNLWAMIRQDPCSLEVTNYLCNIQLARPITGIGVFNVSLIFLGMERAWIAARSHWRMRRQVNPVGADTFLAEKNSVTEKENSKTKKEPNLQSAEPCKGKGKVDPQNNISTVVKIPDLPRRESRPLPTSVTVILSVAFVAALWVGMIGMSVNRIRRIRDPAVILAFCTGRHGNFLTTHVIAVIVNAVSLTIYFGGHLMSQKQLEGFGNSQTSYSLTFVFFSMDICGLERCELRYNIHVTRMVTPVVIYTSVCQLLAGLRYIFTHDQLVAKLSPHTTHIIGLYVFMFVNYTPLVVYGALSLHAFKALQEHGPSLVISQQQQSRIHPTNPRNNNPTALSWAATRNGHGAQPSSRNQTIDQRSDSKPTENRQCGASTQIPSTLMLKSLKLSQIAETHFTAIDEMWN